MAQVQPLPTPKKRSRYVWDYNISESQFQAMLAGTWEFGRLDRDWAAVRLIEYATYEELIRTLGYRALVEGWPRWRDRVRSEHQQLGLDFVVEWVQTHRPDLLEEREDG